MTHAENMAKLRTYLKEETDPQLLAFVSEPTTIHNLLNMALGQFCVAAGIDQHQAMAFFKAFGANSFLGFISPQPVHFRNGIFLTAAI